MERMVFMADDFLKSVGACQSLIIPELMST